MLPPLGRSAPFVVLYRHVDIFNIISIFSFCSLWFFSTWDFRRSTGMMCTPIEEMGVPSRLPRLILPYMVTERTVDWQRAAAAELLRHGGGYSVTGQQRRSYVSFPSSWVSKRRMKWYIKRGKCVRLKRTLKGSEKRREAPHVGKMEKCIAV